MWSWKHAKWGKCWVSCNINSLVPLCLGRFHHTSPSHVKVALNSTQLLTTTLQYSDMTRSLPPSSVWKYIYFRRFFNQDWLKSRGVGLFFCVSFKWGIQLQDVLSWSFCHPGESPSWWMMLVFFQIPKNSRWCIWMWTVDLYGLCQNGFFGSECCRKSTAKQQQAYVAVLGSTTPETCSQLCLPQPLSWFFRCLDCSFHLWINILLSNTCQFFGITKIKRKNTVRACKHHGNLRANPPMTPPPVDEALIRLLRIRAAKSPLTRPYSVHEALLSGGVAIGGGNP